MDGPTNGRTDKRCLINFFCSNLLENGSAQLERFVFVELSGVEENAEELEERRSLARLSRALLKPLDGLGSPENSLRRRRSHLGSFRVVGALKMKIGSFVNYILYIIFFLKFMTNCIGFLSFIKIQLVNDRLINELLNIRCGRWSMSHLMWIKKTRRIPDNLYLLAQKSQVSVILLHSCQ